MVMVLRDILNQKGKEKFDRLEKARAAQSARFAKEFAARERRAKKQFETLSDEDKRYLKQVTEFYKGSFSGMAAKKLAGPSVRRVDPQDLI
jgi:hypothetical protein